MKHIVAAAFLIVGLINLYPVVGAAFRPALRPVAVAAGLVSMLSFVALAVPLSAHNAAMSRVFWADVLASVVLVIAAGLSRRHAARNA